MRFEQIIVAVTRNVVIAIVREIEAVVSFANATRLHLWLRRKPLGMPAYPGNLSHASTLVGDMGGQGTGSKRGRMLCPQIAALASCPAGSATA